MDIRDRRALKYAAGEVLQNPTGDPKRLVLIHAGAVALLSLLSAGLSYYLQHRISDTGGLSGMGMRSVLQTLNEILSLAVTVLPAFWSMGFVYALLKLTRREDTADSDLLQGFRNFGPVLRLMLLQGFLYTTVFMAALSIGSTLLCFTPLATPMYELLLPIVGPDATAADIAALDEATMLALFDAMVPVLIGCMVICMAALLPVVYRLRLTGYFLMDNPREGAIVAMVRSNRAMRRNGWKMVGLDLSFWWFYLAEAFLVIVAYGDYLLALLGVSLPFSSDTAFFVFYVLSLAVQLVLYWFVLMKVELTYVQAYEILRQQEQTPPAEKPAGQLPWNEPPQQ